MYVFVITGKQSASNVAQALGKALANLEQFRAHLFHTLG
jgi:hypothetical protein